MIQSPLSPDSISTWSFVSLLSLLSCRARALITCKRMRHQWSTASQKFNETVCQSANVSWPSNLTKLTKQSQRHFYPWLKFLLLRHGVLHASIVLEPTSTLHHLLSKERIFSRTHLFGKRSHICWCLVHMCWVDPWLAVAWFVIFCSKLIRRLAFSICSSFCNSCLIFLSVLVDGQTTLPRSNLQLSSEQRRPQSRSYFYTRMLR